jgi:hypothetical protein
MFSIGENTLRGGCESGDKELARQPIRRALGLFINVTQIRVG